MVIEAFHFNESGARWVNYLVLSLLANILLFSFVSVDSKALTPSNIPLLKVKLMSFKAPEPLPIKEIIQKTVTPTVKNKKVITEIKAEKIIEKQNPVSKSVPKKINKTVIPEREETIVTKIEILSEENIIPKENIIKNVKEKNHASPEIAKTSTNKPAAGSTIEIKEATYRKQRPPVYPRRALELGQQGNVILHALIKPDGFPSELKIKDSSGYSLLDKAALAAVRKWEFEPTNKDGTTIASWVRVPIEFVIQ